MLGLRGLVLEKEVNVLFALTKVVVYSLGMTAGAWFDVDHMVS